MPKKKSRRPASRTTRSNLTHGRSAHGNEVNGPHRGAMHVMASELRPPKSTKTPGAAETAHIADLSAYPVDPAVLDITRVPFQDALAHREPQALGVTYAFDSGSGGDPFTVAARLRGRRRHVDVPSPADTFDVERHVEPVLPGTGTNTVTWRLLDVSPGEWEVYLDARASSPTAPELPRAGAVGRTGFAPVVRVRAPGVRLGAWPLLVFIGAMVGLAVQGLVARHLGLSVPSVTILTLLASGLGILGGKGYYLALHGDRQERDLMQTGMAVQGFVLVLLAVLGVGAVVTGLPLGGLLDATAPGLLFGMAIGRLGCFLGGCCAGRPTASRFGVWSSDRSVGRRRVPTQFFESAVAGTLAVATLLVLLLSRPSPRGVVFAAGLSAYTLGRQLIFPYRDLPRTTSRGRQLVAVATALTLVVSVALALTG